MRGTISTEPKHEPSSTSTPAQAGPGKVNDFRDRQAKVGDGMEAGAEQARHNTG
jgi:hypothetical protein